MIKGTLFNDFTKRISPITAGLMSNISSIDEKENLKLYSTAFELGINSIDTAPNYLDGYSDIFAGKLIKQFNRDHFFLTSKVYFENNYSECSKGLSDKHIIKTVEGSLKTIQTSHLDCLILHRSDLTTSVTETLGAINKLIKEGKIRTWGISTFSIEEVLDFYYLSKQLDVETPAFAQYAYNLFNRNIEKDLHHILEKKKIKTLAYYPLAQGVLTGKYGHKNILSRQDDPILRKSMWDFTPKKLNLVKTLNEFAQDNGTNLIALSFLWCLRNTNVISLISNFRNKDQLLYNVKCLNSAFDISLEPQIEAILRNKPINQYTGIEYEINKRSL